MANQEQLEILQSGAEKWNNWLQLTRQGPGDLRGANLIEANLSKTNLEGADLERARLQGANLGDANLQGAILNGAKLEGANLITANLQGAKLEGADLSKTDLTGANLRDANLAGALLLNANLAGPDLAGANLAGAYFGGTTLAVLRLAVAEGLTDVDHLGPSYVSTTCLDITAAALSQNQPQQGPVETFLRAAGVEDHWIDYFRSRISQPIEFYSCFISYSHVDADQRFRQAPLRRPAGLRHPMLARRARPLAWAPDPGTRRSSDQDARAGASVLFEGLTGQ